MTAIQRAVIHRAIMRKIMGGVAGAVLAIALVACGPMRVPEASQPTGNTLAAAAASTTRPQATATVWGRVPYCNCFGDAMTTNVANALREAKLTASLQEQSPREGWLYFVVSFDPAAATRTQIGDAIATGGGEMLDGPP